MIVGLGSDMIDIRRIEDVLRRYGARFENRLFTATEQRKARSRLNAGMRIVASTYAKRFAAKEACSKALGTGIRQGVFWRDMEVSNLLSGQPTLTLSGGALRALERLIPTSKKANILLTMTDDYPLAQAIVIIEAV